MINTTSYNFQLIMKFILILFLAVIVIQKITGGIVFHDSAWLFHMTEQWLNGVKPYSELIELNPPMVNLIFIPAVIIHQTLDFSIHYSILIYLTAILIMSFYLIYHQLKKMVTNENAWLMTYTIALFVFLSSVSEFAQRDQIAILMLLPYLLSRYCVSQQQSMTIRTQILYGFLAGLSIAIKPYLIVFMITSEIYVLIKTKKMNHLWCWSNRVIIFIGLLYILFVLAFTDYFEVMFPLAMSTYWAYQNEMNWSVFGLYFTGFTIIYVWSVFDGSKEIKPLMSYLTLLSAASLVSYSLQAHFMYHLSPARLLIALSFTLMCLDTIQKVKLEQHRLLFVRLAFVFMVFVSWSFINKTHLMDVYEKQSLPSAMDYQQDDVKQLVNIINEKFDNKKVYVVSNFLFSASFIGTYTNTIWSANWPALWTLPAVVQAEVNPKQFTEMQYESLKKAKAFTINKFSNDIVKQSPDVIIIDLRNGRFYKNIGFQLYDYLMKQKGISGILQSDYQLSSTKLPELDGYSDPNVYIVLEKRLNNLSAISD